jgi:hypothetical protein
VVALVTPRTANTRQLLRADNLGEATDTQRGGVLKFATAGGSDVVASRDLMAAQQDMAAAVAV